MRQEQRHLISIGTFAFVIPPMKIITCTGALMSNNIRGGGGLPSFNLDFRQADEGNPHPDASQEVSRLHTLAHVASARPRSSSEGLRAAAVHPDIARLYKTVAPQQGVRTPGPSTEDLVRDEGNPHPDASQYLSSLHTLSEVASAVAGSSSAGWRAAAVHSGIEEAFEAVAPQQGGRTQGTSLEDVLEFATMRGHRKALRHLDKWLTNKGKGTLVELVNKDGAEYAEGLALVGAWLAEDPKTNLYCAAEGRQGLNAFNALLKVNGKPTVDWDDFNRNWTVLPLSRKAAQKEADGTNDLLNSVPHNQRSKLNDLIKYLKSKRLGTLQQLVNNCTTADPYANEHVKDWLKEPNNRYGENGKNHGDDGAFAVNSLLRAQGKPKPKAQ